MKIILLVIVVSLLLAVQSRADPVPIGSLDGPTVIAEAEIQSTGQPLLVIGSAILQNGVAAKRLVQKLRATCAVTGGLSFTTPLSTIDLSLSSTFNLIQSHTTIAAESSPPVGLLVCQLVAEVRNTPALFSQVGAGSFFSAELSISHLP